MDAATRTKPGLFAYAWVDLPPGPGPYRWVGWCLRATAALFLAMFAFFLAEVVPMFSVPRFGRLPFLGPMETWLLWLVVVLGAISIVGMAVVGSWFVSYTLFHWVRGDVRGTRHVLYLGIGLLWFGGYGIWSMVRADSMVFEHSRFSGPWAVSLLFDAMMVTLGTLMLVLRASPSAREPFQEGVATSTIQAE
ncbi:MAG TPA: hypothetical protein VM286_05795 [Candidatus Thermoplasmatota archaeon]|nr:hypothetical protein [Candidatus Thermoplasmatota archaeon]